jgi:hypothetical protein
VKDRSLKKVVAGNQKSMYFWPISEEEIVTEVSKLKGKQQRNVMESRILL